MIYLDLPFSEPPEEKRTWIEQKAAHVFAADVEVRYDAGKHQGYTRDGSPIDQFKWLAWTKALYYSRWLLHKGTRWYITYGEPEEKQFSFAHAEEAWAVLTTAAPTAIREIIQLREQGTPWLPGQGWVPIPGLVMRDTEASFPGLFSIDTTDDLRSAKVATWRRLCLGNLTCGDHTIYGLVIEDTRLWLKTSYVICTRRPFPPNLSELKLTKNLVDLTTIRFLWGASLPWGADDWEAIEEETL